MAPGLRWKIFFLATLENAPPWLLSLHYSIMENNSPSFGRDLNRRAILKQTADRGGTQAPCAWLLLWLWMKCEMWPCPRDISKNSWGEFCLSLSLGSSQLICMLPQSGCGLL